MFGNGNKVMMGIEEKKEGNIYIYLILRLTLNM